MAESYTEYVVQDTTNGFVWKDRIHLGGENRENAIQHLRSHIKSSGCHHDHARLVLRTVDEIICVPGAEAFR